MTPKEETKLFNQGCCCVFYGLIALVIGAYYIESKLWYIVAGVALIWLAICRVTHVRDVKRLNTAFEHSFASFPGNRPRLERTSSYSYSNFGLWFGSREEMHQAFVIWVGRRIFMKWDVMRGWPLNHVSGKIISADMGSYKLQTLLYKLDIHGVMESRHLGFGGSSTVSDLLGAKGILEIISTRKAGVLIFLHFPFSLHDA